MKLSHTTDTHTHARVTRHAPNLKELFRQRGELCSLEIGEIRRLARGHDWC